MASNSHATRHREGQGALCAGWGWWEPGHPTAPSHNPVHPCTTHFLSLQRGQPGPSTNLDRGKGLPWEGAALAQRGPLAASPFLFTAQGASALLHGVCGADVRDMKAH